jgi:hypothetical protein
MQTVFVIATLSTGSVAVMQFVTESGGVRRDPTPAAIAKELERVGRSDDGSWREGFPVLLWRIADPSELPAERRYRAAWRDTGSGVEVHMPSARQVRLRELRHARAARLAELDIEWTRTGGGSNGDAVESKRQRLRDMPQIISASLEAAATTSDLDAIGLPE